MDGLDGRVYCVMDSAELGDGAVWESLLAVSSNCPGNLFLVIGTGDCHDDSRRRLKDPDMISGKLTSFGWVATEADGHDFVSLEAAFSRPDLSDARPRVVIARTTAGAAYSDQLAAQKQETPLPVGDLEGTLSQLEREASRRGGGK
jgi:transketolase